MKKFLGICVSFGFSLTCFSTSASAAGASYCCTSNCGSISTERVGPELQALFQQVIGNEFYLSMGPGVELRVEDKDLAGYYRFNASKMKITNRWPDDARLGIEKNSTELDIDKICFNQSGIKITNETSMFDPVGFEFVIPLQTATPISNVPFFNSGCASSEQSLRVNSGDKSFVFLQLPLLNCQ